MIKANIQLNPDATSFYEAKFNPVRRELNYILEALPDIFARTREEIEAEIGEQQTQDLIDRIGCLEDVEIPFPLKGDHPFEMANSDLKSKVERLPQFSRIYLEIEAWKGKLTPAYKPDRKYSGVEFSPEVEKFLLEYFPKAPLGVSYLLNSFPEWCRQALAELPAEVRSSAKEVMHMVRSDNPKAAACLLNARLSSARKPQVQCSAYTMLCLEISGSTYEKKSVQVSPKITPVHRDEMAKIFDGPANFAADYIFHAWPRLYRDTVQAEIEGRFSDQELQQMKDALEGFGTFNGTMAGTVLRMAIQEEHLLKKVEGLSPFGCACLEIQLGVQLGMSRKEELLIA